MRHIIPQALVILSIFTAPALAAPQNPKEVVETIIEKAKGLDNKALAKQNAAEIESLVDFEKLTNEALGEKLKGASAAQRSKIQDLLKKILTRTIYPEAPKFFTDVKVEFTSEKQDAVATTGPRTKVSSVVTKGTKRSTVEYWLAAQNGSYKVVDLAIEGERWVENVHDQFSEVIEKKGYNGLISRMQKRATELATK